ncbi:MAG: metalloregulator ArsR/SmtB family transcription factor [Candidatus Woesearchaeota archaeon]|nr:metalloregulator ArsR/SmtB family transcription factor [Candidatus Woesearchaeota archaeon]
MKCSSYALFFDAFSNKTRWKILEALRFDDLSVNEMCDAIKEEQSKVSHNLKKLVECHFVEAVRKGKNKIYSLNKKTMIPLLEIVENHAGKYCGKTCLRKK